MQLHYVYKINYINSEYTDYKHMIFQYLFLWQQILNEPTL